MLSLLGIVAAMAVSMAGIQGITRGLQELWGRKYRELLSRGGQKPGYWYDLGLGFRGAALALGQSEGTVHLASLTELGFVQGRRTPALLWGQTLGTAVAVMLILGLGQAVDWSVAAFACLVVSLPLRLVKRNHDEAWTDLFLGLGLCFLGLELVMGQTPLVPHDRTMVQTVRILGSGLPGQVLMVVLGVAMGFMSRSSLAVFFLALSLIHRDWIDLAHGFVLATSGILGTGLVGMLQSWSLGPRARRVATVQALALGGQQVVMVFLASVLVNGLLRWVSPPGFSGVLLAPWLGILVFLVQVVSALVAIPVAAMADALDRIPRTTTQQTPDPLAEGVRLVPSHIPDALESNIAILHRSMGKICDSVFELLMVLMNVSQREEPDEGALSQADQVWVRIQVWEREVDEALTATLPMARTRDQSLKIQREGRIHQDLLAIASLAHKGVQSFVRLLRKNYRLHPSSRDELYAFASQVLDFFRYTSDYLTGKIAQPDLELAGRMDHELDRLREQLAKKAARYLEKTQEADPKGELAFVEVLGYLEEVGNHCLRIWR